MHPISKFVSYHRLSNSFKAFTSNMSFVEIPKSIQDTLVVPKRRETVMEEMRVLEMNGALDMVS